VLMTPMVLLLLPPKFGIGLIGPVMLLMAATGVRQYWKQWDNRCLLVLLPAMLVGIWAGTHLLAVISGDAVRRLWEVWRSVSESSSTCPSTGRHGKRGFAPIPGREWFWALPRESSAPWRTWRDCLRFLPAAPQPHERGLRGTTVFLFFASGLLKIGTYLSYHILTLPMIFLSLSLLPALSWVRSAANA